MGLQAYLTLAAVVFCLGLFGVVTRRNTVGILLGIELMLNAVNINLVAFARFRADIGGLVAQKIACMDLAAAAVAIDPAPFRGVLRLPLSSLRSAFPALKNPFNASKAVMLTLEQVTYAFANASYRRYRKVPAEIVEIPGRGHSLTIDAGWRDVADVALGFLERNGLT